MRIRDESGMGLLELLIAMVVLNIGLFAVVGVFNGATVAIARAATISSATAVADRQMEIYRSLQNCAIWLDTTTPPPVLPATTPPGTTFPVKGAGSTYEADTRSYTNVYTFTGPNQTGVPVAFLDKSQSVPLQAWEKWATWSTSTLVLTDWSGDIPTSCKPSGPGALTATSTPTLSATQPIQDVQGPDGVTYPVYTYIIIIQPTNSTATYTGTYVKQVTVVVRDPRNSAKILARETSIFNPMSG
jgi:type II secretory pathway pseudopilin PulG